MLQKYMSDAADDQKMAYCLSNVDEGVYFYPHAL